MLSHILFDFKILQLIDRTAFQLNRSEQVKLSNNIIGMNEAATT